MIRTDSLQFSVRFDVLLKIRLDKVQVWDDDLRQYDASWKDDWFRYCREFMWIYATFVPQEGAAQEKKSSIKITWLSGTFNAVIVCHRLMRARKEEKSRCSCDSTANLITNNTNSHWCRCRRHPACCLQIHVIVNVPPRTTGSLECSPLESVKQTYYRAHRSLVARRRATSRLDDKSDKCGKNTSPSASFPRARRHIWALNLLLSEMFTWIVILNIPKFNSITEYHLRPCFLFLH